MTTDPFFHLWTAAVYLYAAGALLVANGCDLVRWARQRINSKEASR